MAEPKTMITGVMLRDTRGLHHKSNQPTMIPPVVLKTVWQKQRIKSPSGNDVSNLKKLVEKYNR